MKNKNTKNRNVKTEPNCLTCTIASEREAIQPIEAKQSSQLKKTLIVTKAQALIPVTT